MASERVLIERVHPIVWHVEVDLGPPTYKHCIVDVASIEKAIAEVANIFGVPMTAQAALGNVSDVDGAQAADTPAATAAHSEE
jgi:hypothetical protein